MKTKTMVINVKRRAYRGRAKVDADWRVSLAGNRFNLVFTATPLNDVNEKSVQWDVTHLRPVKLDQLTDAWVERHYDALVRSKHVMHVPV